MRTPAPSRRFGLFAAAIGASCALLAPPLLAQVAPEAPPPAARTVPVNPTSQCAEGPGAPPADPSKVTRVPADSRGRPIAQEPPPIDEPASPGAPDPVLLEIGAHAGASVRLDEGGFFLMSRRAGLVLGGSLFVWPNRTLAFGLDYARAQLDRVESPPGSADTVITDHAAHTLMAEARAVPFRFSVASVFATVGAGLAWQTASTRGTVTPRDGALGGSFVCDVAGGADFAFRAGIGVKARLTRAASLLAAADFVGYRFTTDLLDGCAFGAGTAQTLMLRAAVTYDVDISRLIR